MNEDLMYSTLEDQEFWLKCVHGLPPLQGFSGTGNDKFGQPIAWGTGPHSLKAFRETFDIVKPKSIYEIGFNMGYASAVFLGLSSYCHVYSCDISMKDETIEAANILMSAHSGRFMYYNRNTESHSHKLIDTPFDLCFIDGGHLMDNVMADIKECLSLPIQYFLFDDILPNFGDVQECIDKFKELELIKIWGNIALYKNISYE